MKSMKKILSLILVLVLALGCLGMSASATNPVYPPVQSVTVNNNLAQLNTSGTTLTYCARVTGADLSTTTFTIVMVISDPSKKRICNTKQCHWDYYHQRSL